jgi:hypothetical protein
MASVIVNRTHAVCGPGIEVASVAVSKLGFGLDLMVHRVLMSMRGGARRRVVVLVRGRPELKVGWECTQERSGRKIVGKLQRRKRERREEEEERMGSTPTRAALFIGGSTGSAHCGPFRRTTCYNGSISIILREDCTRFVVNKLSHDLNSEFRSSGTSKTPSGHPDSKQVRQAPTSH